MTDTNHPRPQHPPRSTASSVCIELQKSCVYRTYTVRYFYVFLFPLFLSSFVIYQIQIFNPLRCLSDRPQAIESEFRITQNSDDSRLDALLAQFVGGTQWKIGKAARNETEFKSVENPTEVYLMISNYP